MMSKKIQWYNLPPRFLFLKGIKKASDYLNRRQWPAQYLTSLYETQNKILLNFYSNVFNDTLLRLDSVSESAEPFVGNSLGKAPIWMLWLQGFSEFPHDISFCIESIKKHSSGHPINFLDLSEARKLVDIPDLIIMLYNERKLRPALLCDYIRAALLEKYGGIWLDSTIMLVRDIPDWILKIPFWSVKGLDFFPYSVVVPDGRNWQIYAMASQPHALFYKGFCELFLEYCEKIDTSIDYFMSYQISYLLRTQVNSIEASYRLIPRNNSKCESLQAFLQDYMPIKDAGFDSIKDNDTFLYKLSRYNVDVLCKAHAFLNSINFD